MQFVIGIIGIVSLLFSLLCLCFPDVLSYLNALGREIVLDISGLLQRYRVIIGIIYLTAGIFLVYIGFYYK